MGVVQQDTTPSEENVGCSPTHKAKTEEEEERNCGGVWLTKGCGPWSAQVGQVDMDNSSRQMARHVQIQQAPLHCVQKQVGNEMYWMQHSAIENFRVRRVAS